MRAQMPTFRPQCEQLEAREVPSFGTGGFVATDLAHTTGESSRDVEVQSDGKIVAVCHVGIVRHNADGSLDPTFNAGGAQPGVVPITASHLRDMDLVIQPDGKLLIGSSVATGTKLMAQLLRFNANGTPDATFGTNGKVTNDFKRGNDPDIIQELALQADGKIVAAVTINGTTWGVARFNANGSLDTSFDKDGWLTTDFGTGRAPVVSSLAVQPDGRIVVGGNVVTTTRQADNAIARYLPNGALDTSFGTAGKVLVDFGPEYAPGVTPPDSLRDLAVQPDGRIVFVGYSSAGGVWFGLMGRLNSNGSLDTTFGGNGLMIVGSPGYEHPEYGTIYPKIQFENVSIQADGKIVAYSPGFGYDNWPSALVRVNADGTLDTSFSGDGIEQFTWPFTVGGSNAGGLALQPDGKIVVSTIAVGDIVALARFNPDGTLDV